MSIKRHGSAQTGAGGANLPFARAVEADGWLYVSGQVAMEISDVLTASQEINAFSSNVKEKAILLNDVMLQLKALTEKYQI